MPGDASQQTGGRTHPRVLQRKRAVTKSEWPSDWGSSLEEASKSYDESKKSGEGLRAKITDWKLDKNKFTPTTGDSISVKGPYSTKEELKQRGYTHSKLVTGTGNVKLVSHRGAKKLPFTPPEMAANYPGDYTNYYDLRTGQFTAAWNMKDHDEGRVAGKAPISNSEIIWKQYKLGLESLGAPYEQGKSGKQKRKKKGNFKEIHRSTIINQKTKDTMFLCDGALASENKAQKVGPNDEDFWALLGSPNGNSSAWLLLQHGTSMGASDIESITYEVGSSNQMWIKFALETGG